jgi:hypothetical protein
VNLLALKSIQDLADYILMRDFLRESSSLRATELQTVCAHLSSEMWAVRHRIALNFKHSIDPRD